MHSVAYENICFSSLFVAGDVLDGETSATQQQKFHTDDVKSVWNPVRSADWSTQVSYIVLAIVYEWQSWQTKDKRPQRSNVNVKNL